MNLSDWILFWAPKKVRSISSEIFQGTYALLLWRFLARRGFGYLKLPSLNWRNLIYFIPAVYEIYWALDPVYYAPATLKHLTYSSLVVLGIGFGEEMLCRGFAFNYLSRFGIFLGVLGSSIFFGLMHITNAIFGQSISSTIAQIINAMGMGVLACGLMLATKSIWPAVLMHAINDLPMTVLEVKKIKFAVSPMDILGTAAWSTIPIVLGLALTLIALLRDDLLFARASRFDRDLVLLAEGVFQRVGEKLLGSKVFSYLGLVENLD
jgi:membrane protease YdiL (CAAX protease family)